MRLARKWAVPVSILLGLGLAISIPWMLATLTDNASSHGHIAIIVALAFLLAVVGSLIVLFAYLGAAAIIPKSLYRIMVWVTLRTVRSGITRLTLPIEPSGIAEIEGDVGIGIPLGFQDGVIEGDRFIVLNTTSQEKWGGIQVYEIQEDSCVCSVSDRINPDFWNALEERMRHDASPPQGVTIRREIPDELLLDWLTRLLKAPRG